MDLAHASGGRPDLWVVGGPLRPAQPGRVERLHRMAALEERLSNRRFLVGGQLTEADVRRSGEADRESLRRRAAHAGPIGDDTLLYRVEFHLVAD